MKKRIIFLLAAIFMIGMTTTSCKSSRKKKKCNTCPTWDHIDVDITKKEK